jgi:hypothetical protein
MAVITVHLGLERYIALAFIWHSASSNRDLALIELN